MILCLSSVAWALRAPAPQPAQIHQPEHRTRDSMTAVNHFSIRPAQPSDVAHIHAHDRRAGRVRKTRTHGGRHRSACCTKACSARARPARRSSARKTARWSRFALFFHNFSTFLTKKGLYLEDLYVKQAHRGKGYRHARCWCSWRRSRSSATAAASSGRCWTGTSRRSVLQGDGRRHHAGLAHLPRHRRRAGQAGGAGRPEQSARQEKTHGKKHRGLTQLFRMGRGDLNQRFHYSVRINERFCDSLQLLTWCLMHR